MEHQRWIKQSLVSAAVAALIGLTACSGGSDSDSGGGAVDTTTTLSGIVADGYLLNATVCLDLNLSKTCDSGEPTATSTKGGKYSLDATKVQIDTFPVIAEIIAGITVDEDNPDAPVAKAYALTAPAGKGAFVSPLTTMVQAQIETTGKTSEQIENEILASMGQDPTVVSLFDDYVAKKADTTSPTAVQDSYLQLHQIAQVTATTIANNIEVIEEAIKSGEVNLDLATTLDSLITIIVQNVIAELSTISTEIENATSFDANAIATTVNATVDTDTIDDQVAVAEAPSVPTSNTEAVFTTGISWLWAEFGEWENELERSIITYDATTGKLSEPIESYFSTNTPGWSLLPNENDKLVLQADGSWKGITDSLDGSFVTFDNTTGTATINNPWGMEVMSNVQASDLTDLSIKQFVANKLPDLAKYIDHTSTFTSGSKAYSLNSTSLEDSYNIWIWDSCGIGFYNVNGNCNTIVDYNTGNAVFTSLTDIPVPIAWVDPGDSSSNPIAIGYLGSNNTQAIHYELVQGATNTSGEVNYYLYNYGNAFTITKVGTGTWTITTVNGAELLMIDHPDAIMNQYSHVIDMDSPEENHFIAIQDGAARWGDHWSANIVEDTAESLLTNQQAQNEITGAFLSASVINTTPSAELVCDTESDWNPLIDEPLVTYSFANFESVVNTCGGALAVDASVLADNGSGSRTYSLSDGTTITFNLDNTGYYTENGQPASSFNWTIDQATKYITLDNPDGSSRDILAVTVFAIDPITFQTNFTFKGYIEEVGRSDMFTNKGSDGQIVDLSPIAF